MIYNFHMLEREYFSIGEKRIGSFEAIFLIGIIAWFVGAVIKIESDAIDFSGNEAALFASVNKTMPEVETPVLSIDLEAPKVNIKQITGGYVSAGASDNVGVTQIDIFDGESLKISCFDEAFCAYKPSSSSRDISAKAYDATGNSGTAKSSLGR